jgi:hypothetical protein
VPWVPLLGLRTLPVSWVPLLALRILSVSWVPLLALRILSVPEVPLRTALGMRLCVVLALRMPWAQRAAVFLVSRRVVSQRWR